jgi:hypothetical protein
MDFESFAELKIAALDKAGEVTDGTSDYDTICQQQMNQLYRSFLSGGNEYDVTLAEIWEWAKAKDPGVLTLLPPFVTGTVSLTNGSASGTFSSAPAASLGSFTGRFFRVTSRNTVYRIASHVAGAAAFTLDQLYLEATGTALTFEAIKLDYELTAGIDRLVGEFALFDRSENADGPRIEGIDFAQFNRSYPAAYVREGIPDRFTIVSDENGLLTVRFNRYPNGSIRCEYDYIPQAEKLCIASVTADASTDKLTSVAHGLIAGQRVKVSLARSAVVPTGLKTDKIYYVVSANDDDFKLSLTSGGTAIDITGAGSGTIYVSNLPKIPLAHRQVLMYAGIHVTMMDKGDSRTDYYYRQTQATLQAMIAANRRLKSKTSQNRARMISRPEQVATTNSLYNRIPWGY